MEFRTKVELPKDDFCFGLDDRLLVMGSCFAEHIGQYLTSNKFRVEVNPFGVLYNPESIAEALDLLADLAEGKPYPQSFFFKADGLWHSWLHSSAFSGLTRQECAVHVMAPLKRIVPTLGQNYALIVTFGTNVVYRLKTSGFVVGNCHRQPASLFSEEELTVDEICLRYTTLLSRLFRLMPRLRVVFTVSPYRYAKYGFHRSRLAKASLLLAIETLTQRFVGRCYYFPAYEIVLDELRDYRFYAPDMLHPSAEAIAYVTERFADYAIDAPARAFMDEWKGVEKSLKHRPLHSQTDEYRIFLEKLRERIVGFSKKYANLAFQNELAEVNRRLEEATKER